MPDLDRFGGVARLYGPLALEKLSRAHVCIIGVGGVGSWIVEALARSGVGRMTLIDMDDVCVTNTNRQVPALEGEYGRPKIDVLAERVRRIHPQCEVTLQPEFLTESTAERLIHTGYTHVVDAVDRMTPKALIIARSRELGLDAITIGGAGGRRDPTRIRVGDLGSTSGDMLLRLVRKKLRRAHGWPQGNGHVMGVGAVYSSEPQVYPWASGEVCATPEPGSNLHMDCASGFGAACFVTGAFGFAASGEIVRRIVEAP
ncbi:MAG TPA: tRNA threonylcarbamoyladenosine dehydratase [Chthoniobacteraceae bacterium]|jgi:tRNA A37 threonylcarbamoyladenosine dehydratase|nr:tRNA threonylcarbamoyladenosine dehydratase [Chthoniobacteraceae bacterium]